MNFSVCGMESGGAEGQHRSVTTGNTMMLLMKAYSVQVPSRGSFAQKDESVRFKPGCLGKAAPPNGGKSRHGSRFMHRESHDVCRPTSPTELQSTSTMRRTRPPSHLEEVRTRAIP